MKIPNFDDKDLAIISLALIALVAAFVQEDSMTIISSAISAIAGLAVGRKLGDK